jgi:hypothetical protein
MRFLLVWTTLALASSLHAAPQQRTLVFELSGDAPAEQRSRMTSIIAGRLQRFPSLAVVSGAVLQNQLDSTEAKAIIGDACAELSSDGCRQRLATALDASWSCTGDATVLGTTTTIRLALQRTSATDNAEPVTTSIDINSLDDMSARLSRAIDQLGENATAEKPIDPPISAINTLPDLGMPLTIAGGVLAGVGVVGIIGGAIPSLLYGNAHGSLIDLRNQYREAPSDDLITQGQQRRAEAIGYKDAHNNIGVYVVAASVAAVIIGGGGAAAAYFLWPTPTDANNQNAEVQP